MKHEKIKTDNGLETLFIHSPGSSAACVQLWFRAGSSLEEEEHFGIAHFLEHMFFKGTKKRPGSAIAHEVESFGGEINAFTSFDYTCYYINTPNSYLPQSTEILLDMAGNPLFLMEELVPERGVVFEEFRRSMDGPDQYLFHRIQENCFTGGYRHGILGVEETIKNFSREQLIQFRKKYYNLKNALLIIAGDVDDKKQYLKIFKDCHIPQGPASKFSQFKLKKELAIEVHKKDVKMSSLTLSIDAAGFNTDQAAAENLVLGVMGQGQSSRMYQDLVVKNTLANTAGTSSLYMANGGVHVIKTTFPPENLKKIIEELTSLLEEIIEEKFTSKEMQKISNQYIASKVYDRETIESYSFCAGHGYAQNGDINCEAEFIDRVKNTSLSKVNQAIEDIFTRNIHINLQIPENHPLEPDHVQLENFQKKLSTLYGKQKSISRLSKTVSIYDPAVSLTCLEEGVDFLHRKNTVSPTFVMHAYLRSGLSDENKEEGGIYCLLSSLLNKGYSSFDRKQLGLDLDEKSASLSGFSGKNSYGLTLHGQTEHANELMDHFFGSLLGPSFLEREVNHEKEITRRVLDEQKTDPVKQCFLKVSEIMFENHPYAKNSLGSKESLQGIGSQRIISLHKKNLAEKRILLAYCGDLDFDTIYSLSRRKMNLKGRKRTSLVNKEFIVPTGRREFVSLHREQAHIFIGLPSKDFDSREHISLKMLTAHLGGQSSELFVDIRDKKGLCYSICPIHHMAVEGGYWGIYLASGHDKVNTAIDSVNAILERIKDKGMPREDFMRIKKMIEGQNLLNLQTNEDYAGAYSLPILHDLGIDYFHQKNMDIKDIKYEEFNSTLQEFFSGSWNQVVVGIE